MDTLIFNNDLYGETQRIETIADAREVILRLVEQNHMQCKQLNDMLSNLTSENITELDFAVTRIKSFDC